MKNLERIFCVTFFINIVTMCLMRSFSHACVHLTFSNVLTVLVLTSEERAIRSFGVSVPSEWSWIESQESEVGVSGRGLCDL